MELETMHWVALLVGAFMVGLSKSGVPGVGNIAIAMFAMVLPARISVGVILPILITADLVAVVTYRKHVSWKYIWSLFPASAVGVVVGYFALDYIDDRAVRLIIAAILFLGIAHTVWRAIQKHFWDEPKEPGRHWAPVIGMAVGIVTMIANAAGPITQLYFLAMRFPKMMFIGTGAWYIMLVNVFKVPFSIGQGMITVPTAVLSSYLILPAVIGGLVAPWIVRRISQKLFERLVLFFIFFSAVALLVRG